MCLIFTLQKNHLFRETMTNIKKKVKKYKCHITAVMAGNTSPGHDDPESMTPRLPTKLPNDCGPAINTFSLYKVVI